MTSDAQARPQEDDDRDAASSADEAPCTGRPTRRADDAERRRRSAGAQAPRRERRGETVPRHAGDPRRGPRFPVVPVLTVLLVLLLAGVGYLWFTRPATSSIRTSDYVGALEAARSGVVDLTSFDYLTLDDDLRADQAGDDRRPAEGVDRPAQPAAQGHHRLPGGGEHQGRGRRGHPGHHGQRHRRARHRVDDRRRKSSAQAQVVRYRIEVQLKDVDGRWLLSGITGR